MRFLFLLLCVLSPSVFAASPVANNNASEPVAIEADTQLEWLKADNKFRATGNVVITQGTTSIKGDNAEALYDAAKGPSALTEMIVTGNVIIKSDDNTATAEQATYNTITQIATLRGKHIVLTTPKASVTAQSGMDYDVANRKVTSKGPSVVTQGTDKIQSDQLTVWLTEKNEMKRAEARGHVIITQKTADGTNIAQAERGDYDAVGKQATLTGNVKLTQGQNHMQGDAATINLATGYSSLKNNAATGGRVRAIFNPEGSDNKMPTLKTALPNVTPKENFEQPFVTGR